MKSEFADEWDKWLKTDEGLECLEDADEDTVKTIFIAGAEASERAKAVIHKKLQKSGIEYCHKHGGYGFQSNCKKCRQAS
ncbi:MAG: hypothetical protein V3V40_06010 [Nitrosomonadaceae bacterium]